MPRPPVQPSDGRPVVSLNLEELKFWLSIMQEHALFIKAGLPADRKEAIQEAQDFYRSFGNLLAKADSVHNDKKIAELIRQTISKTEDFYRFKRRLLQVALRGELGGSLYPSMLDHVAREAEYFLRLLESMNDCKPFALWPKTREAGFWIRLMSDHSHFIRQMLDPSEMILIETTESFGEEFDRLFRQSVDFSSLLRGTSSNVPAFSRFLQDSRAAGIRLRDFKRALHSMLEEKKVLSLMTPLFADHIRREADHFLVISAMLENNVQTCGYTGVNNLKVPLAAEEVEDIAPGLADETMLADSTVLADDSLSANLVAQAKLAALQQKMMQEKLEAATNTVAQPSLITDSEMLEEVDDEEEEPPSVVSAAQIDTSPSKLKYKWSAAWPRPLGGDK